MSKATMVIDDEFVSLWYHPDEKIIHHRIKKFPSSEMFRDLLSTGADWLEKHHAKKWLSDDRDNTVVRKEDYIWGDTVWAPRVICAGFKYWAIVLPAHAIGQLQMRRFAEEYQARGVTVQTFTTEEDAIAWLDSMVD